MYILTLFIISLLVFRLNPVPLEKISSKDVFKYGILTLVLYFVSVTIQAVFIHFGMASNVNLGEMSTDMGVPLMVFLILVFSPFVEEFLFRFGIIEGLNYILKKLKIKNTIPLNLIIIAVSAACFSIAHSGGVGQTVYTFLLGMYLGYLYVKKRNLLFTIGMHMLFNSISIGLFLINMII